MFEKIAMYLRRRRQYKETVKELSRLSNRELSDLGISRGQIPGISRMSVYN